MSTNSKSEPYMMRPLVTKLLTWMRGKTAIGGWFTSRRNLSPSQASLHPSATWKPDTYTELAYQWDIVDKGCSGSSYGCVRLKRVNSAGLVS
jgi:hypothetical protein